MTINEFISKNKYTLLLALACTLFMAPDVSWAANPVVDKFTPAPVFKTAMIKLFRTFQNSKMVLLIIGGFGLIGFAFLAIFGKVKWAWFASLGFGLAVVAAAGAIVKYATDMDTANNSLTKQFKELEKNYGGFEDTYKKTIVDPSEENKKDKNTGVNGGVNNGINTGIEGKSNPGGAVPEQIGDASDLIK